MNPSISESRSAKFLDLIRRAERGRLKVYLGYGPGVGKTYLMLQEARRLQREGIDVVVGLVETHGRAETAALVDGLEVLPRLKTEYRGITIEEFDLAGCIARKPQVAIVDELAHTNVPGSKNAKRYEDVQELLAAGVHVITALNIQHLESLYNTVEGLVGVKVRERVPDSVLAQADQVVNVDVAPEDLQQRLRDGKIYPAQRVESSLEHFFRENNLQHLRELALRELASQIDAKRRERPETAAPPSGLDQVMVCLSSRGPSSARLLRVGSRLAGRLNRNWYAVYVQTPDEDPLKIDARTQRLLADTLTLANQLGATVFTFKGTDVAETIMRFAREYRVGQVVIGKPRPIAWYRRLLGAKSVAEQLLFKATAVTVIVVDAESTEQFVTHQPTIDLTASDQPLSSTPGAAPAAPPKPKTPLAALADPARIILYDGPVTRDRVTADLVAAVTRANPSIRPEEIATRLAEREKLGSTFLNEGVALPHARLAGLSAPEIALAITPAGITDAPTTKPVEVTFLLLSPESSATNHLQSLAAAARLFQSADLRKRLTTCASRESAAQELSTRV